MTNTIININPGMRAPAICLFLAAVTALPACARAPEPQVASSTLTVAAEAAPQAATSGLASDTRVLPLPTVLVHKSPTCGCCTAWVDHMRQAGFPVEVRNVDNLDPVKTRLGIPYGKGSCHTAEVAGYFVEGHVPAADIKRLLAQQPDAKGLVLPGMPLGSPGMEVPDGTVQPFTVELIDRQGAATAFARH